MISWKWLLLIVPLVFWFGFFLGVAMSNSSHYDDLVEKINEDKQ